VKELASLLHMPAHFVDRGGAALIRRPLGRPQSFLSLNLTSEYQGQTRHVFRCRFDVPGYGPVDAFAVHLWPAGGELVEDLHILQLLEDQRRLGVPQLLLGDFNRTHDCELFRRLRQRGWVTQSTQENRALQGTKVIGHNAIDGVWWRGMEDWEVLECQPIRHERTMPNEKGFASSDHLPVRAVWRYTKVN
jgi:endonuclease/exonuclease/phosphatase family metal-dependent hydrolase